MRFLSFLCSKPESFPESGTYFLGLFSVTYLREDSITNLQSNVTEGECEGCEEVGREGSRREGEQEEAHGGSRRKGGGELGAAAGGRGRGGLQLE